MQMNFSIIIPHRNLPFLLERLLKSIPEREDLEIIVVDDHSDKSIVDFNHFPGKDRKNFLLLYNEGKRGAGYARNYALPYARGKWVLFADSDDFFNSGFDAFLNDYVNSDVDIVYFNANSVDTETFEASDRADHLNSFIDSYYLDKKHGDFVMRYFATEPWCKMIKREIIDANNVRFDVTSIHEDVKFSCLIGYYAKRIKVEKGKYYCVTSRATSLSRTKTHQAYLDELKVFAWWNKFLLEHQIPLELPKFEYRAYNFFRHLYKDNKLFREEFVILRKVGFSRLFILNLLLKNLYKSFKYKINNIADS